MLYFSRLLSVSALLTIATAGCRVTDMPLWKPATPAVSDGCKVEKIGDIAYLDGPRGKNFRHHLDLFVPKGKKDFPVVVLFHGGAWMVGDNRCCGLYSSVGEFLASQGIGVVMPNYRLSPGVKHPDHAIDAARAIAWTRTHIGEYGGRPDAIFLAGHSAGGHLAALLATDETYLRAEKLRIDDVRGVIAISGVYEIPPGELKGTLGGSGPMAITWNSVAPLRGERGGALAPSWGLSMSVNLFGPVFGNDPKAREAASPIHHVRRALPPFLLVSAKNDLPLLDDMACRFQKELTAAGCSAKHLRVAKRNHNSIFFNATTREDPVALAMLDFIRDNLKTEPIEP